MNGPATNGAKPATNGVHTAEHTHVDRIEENLKQLDRYDVEWYAQVAARNRAAEQRREDRQRDR